MLANLTALIMTRSSMGGGRWAATSPEMTDDGFPNKARSGCCGSDYHNSPRPSMTTVEVDAYVIDTLLPDLVGHDRRPSAFLVYLHLWRQSGGGAEEVSRSLREIADGTGLSKRAVQEALEQLARRRLVTADREAITAVATFRVRRPWAERWR
jgi:DNA-binding transcriptional ArsR family regulator